MPRFDKITQRILQILQKDARITNADLASQVGIPPTSMSDRLRRLQRDGVILSYTARLDPQKLGLEMLVFIEIRLDKTTPLWREFSQDSAIGLQFSGNWPDLQLEFYAVREGR